MEVPLLRVMKFCENRQVTGPRRAGSAVAVHHRLMAVLGSLRAPVAARLLLARRAAPAPQAQPAALHGSSWSARSGRSTPRWPCEWSSPGAWSGRGEEAAPPKAADQAVGRRAGLTYGRAGA